MIEIAIENVVLPGRIGVFEQERIVGNMFEISIIVRIPETDNMRHDNLEGTISYADIFDLLRAELEHQCMLLEHFCIKIVERIKERWPFIQSGEIKIVKLQPPIPGFTGTASVKKFF